MSAETALQHPAVWRAVQLISTTVATLPLKIYRRLPDDGRVPEIAHPLYPLLHQSANAEMSSLTFREVLQRDLLVFGNAFAEVERDGRGRVVALWPLQAKKMTLQRDKDRRLVYSYQPQAQRFTWTGTPGRPAPIFHIRAHSVDGIVGRSPIEVARNAIGGALATEEHGYRHFANGASPGGVLQGPRGARLTDGAHQRLRASWEAAHKGVSRAHRVALLEDGWQFSPISVANRASEWIASRQLNVTDIARLFGLPPSSLYDLERATYSNAEQQQIAFSREIAVWLDRWTSEIGRTLISDRGRWYAAFTTAALARGDLQSRYTAYSVGRQHGWLSINEVRRLEDMPPIAGEGGDRYMTPLNMADVNATDDREATLNADDLALMSHAGGMQ